MADDLNLVVPLDELDDFKVAEGDPDVRGWDVIASDGRKIGEVDQLLVDPRAMMVRYLDVDLDDELIGEDGDRHILVPIGYARLDEDDDQVFVDQIASTRLRDIPAYNHTTLTRDYETSLARAYQPGYTAGSDDFYSGDLYDSDRFYGSRRRRTT